jgi:hypothetical protein
MTLPFLLTWALLSLATILSWWLDTTYDGRWVGAAVLLVAFFKGRLVLMVFMGVRQAPPAIRRSCEGWVVSACALVLTTYWFAPFI